MKVLLFPVIACLVTMIAFAETDLQYSVVLTEEMTTFAMLKPKRTYGSTQRNIGSKSNS